MVKRYIILILFPLLCYAESIPFYKGYLFYKDYLQELDFDEVIRGMKAAHDGLVISEEEIKKKKSDLYEKKKQDNLSIANRFLSNIALQDETIELVKDKLYYKITQEGSGSKVQEKDMPTLLYKAKTIVNGNEDLIHQIEEPKAILMRSTIPGFAKGVVGMQIGEKRTLYVHPDLAYGQISKKVDPNSILIFEIEVVKN